MGGSLKEREDTLYTCCDEEGRGQATMPARAPYHTPMRAKPRETRRARPRLRTLESSSDMFVIARTAH